VCIVIKHEAEVSKLSFIVMQKAEQIDAKDATHAI